MRLGELTWPDDKDLRDPRKLTKRSSVVINDTSLQFFFAQPQGQQALRGKHHHRVPKPFPLQSNGIMQILPAILQSPVPLVLSSMANSKWISPEALFLHASPAPLL
jgi:hypothetical protein